MTKQSSWPLALTRVAASLALIAGASSAWASPRDFPSNFGLSVAGSVFTGQQGTMRSNLGFDRDSYSIDTYNQQSYPPLTGQTEGEGQTRDTHAISQAKADFGTLGVRTYSWLYDFPHDLGPYPWAFNNGEWALLSVFSEASASFFDSWRPTSPDLPDGSIGTLDVSVEIGLPGILDQPDNLYDSAGLKLTLTDHTYSRSHSVSRPSPGTHVLSVPAIMGQLSDIELNLDAGTISGWAANDGVVLSGGGAMEVDFLHTASITGITLRDGNGLAITDFNLFTLSGHDYLNAAPPPSGVPEPASLLLTLLGLAGLTLRRKAHG